MEKIYAEHQPFSTLVNEGHEKEVRYESITLSKWDNLNHLHGF